MKTHRHRGAIETAKPDCSIFEHTISFSNDCWAQWTLFEFRTLFALRTSPPRCISLTVRVLTMSQCSLNEVTMAKIGAGRYPERSQAVHGAGNAIYDNQRHPPAGFYYTRRFIISEGPTTAQRQAPEMHRHGPLETFLHGMVIACS